MAEKGSGKPVTDGKQEKESTAAGESLSEKKETKASEIEQGLGKKFEIGKLRENCMQLFHVTASTFDGAFYGRTEKEMSIQEAAAAIQGWLGKGR